MKRNLCDDCKECKDNDKSISYCFDVCGIPIDILCDVEKERYKTNKIASEWIPVTEMLPTDCRNVLVTLVGQDTTYTYVDFYVNSEGRWYSDNEVIAWMPLPEPYKAGE